jgi:hypothetical protein
MSDKHLEPWEEEAEKMFNKYNELDLTTADVKRCCVIAMNKCIEISDTLGEIYWGEAKFYIKNKVI